MNKEVKALEDGGAGDRVVIFDLELPQIPDLDGDSLDLEKLGSAPLSTYIKYTGMQLGDQIVPQFFGCGPAGEVVDRERVPVVISDLEADGSFKLELRNDLLTRLDKGVAFYSYIKTLPPKDTPAQTRLEEQSARLLFYVNKQRAPAESLPPPHFMDSDGLIIDLARVTDDGTVITTAFPVMSVDDEVRLFWKDAFYSDNFSKKLVQEDLGKPLVWRIDRQILMLAGDWCEMSYSITYADGGKPSQSPTQRFTIVTGSPVQQPSLPSPQVPDHEDGHLDPDEFPDGMTVEVDDYGIQHADELLLHAIGKQNNRTTFRVDRTVLDSGRLRFAVPSQWLRANTGEVASLTWQWARAGGAADSAPLELTLRKPPDLKLPIIEYATPQDPDASEELDPDIDDYGFVLPIRLIQGAYVKVPDESETGGGRVTVHWDGFGARGKYSTSSPTAGDNLRYLIPSTAVPANLGKRLKVYYEVEVLGKTVHKSPVYGLKIEELQTSSFGPIECPDAHDGKLSLGNVVDSVKFILTSDSWRFFDQGHIVRVQVTGKAKPEYSPLPAEVIRDDVPVSEEEWREGRLEMTLSKEFLNKLELSTYIQVSMWISFDEGVTFKSSIPVDLWLGR